MSGANSGATIITFLEISLLRIIIVFKIGGHP